MKKILLIALCTLIGVAVYAQDCYNSTRKQGIDYYNQGKKTEAKRYFVAAQSCPDKPANNDLQSWIKKCDATPKSDNNTNAKASVIVENVRLINTVTGEIVEPPIYQGDMGDLAPRIYYRGETTTTTKVALNMKLLNPSDKLMKNSSSPSGYTSMRNVSLMSGVQDSVTMPSLFNYNNGVYSNGEYTYEVYYQNALVYSRKFSVVANRPKLNINGTEDGAINTPTLSYLGGPVTYSIEADELYEVVNNATWINVKSRSLNRLEIMVRENPNEYSRNDFLVVKVPGKQRTINIRQEGRPAEPKATEATPVATKEYDAEARIEVGAGLLLTMTSASFPGRATQSVINFGVNDLYDCYTAPNYSSGIGFNVHANYWMPVAQNIYVIAGLGISNGGFTNEFKMDNLVFTFSGVKWYPEETSKETYRMTYLDIPVMGAYNSPFDEKSGLVLKGGLVFGFGLSGTLKMNARLYEQTEPDAQGNYTYRESTIKGDINLFSGKYKLTQQYSTGAASTYNINGNAKNPYKRLNMSLTLGADVVFDKVTFGLAYNLGLSNIANKAYWGNPESQVPGYYLVGNPKFYDTAEPLSGYSQHLSSLSISVGYSF